MNLTFKRLHPDAVLPTYAHEGDSGMDLRAVEDVVLLPGVPTLVRTGLAVELPPTGAFNLYRKGCDGPYFFNAIMDVLFEAQIRPRSGLALKHGITVVNAPGTVDSGFRGEIGVILRWDGHKPNATPYFHGDKGTELRYFTAQEGIFLSPAYERADALMAYKIHKGDRIAQMVIAPVVRCVPQWGEVGETERGGSGFGSTGK